MAVRHDVTHRLDAGYPDTAPVSSAPARELIMPFRAVLVFLSLAVSACRDLPVAPVSPPEGLPVSLEIGQGAMSTYDPRTPILAAGDSLVISAVLSSAGCAPVVASAGHAGDLLVVTLTSRAAEQPQICIAMARSELVRTVVRPAPAGRYTVVLRRRFEGYNGQAAQEREILRGAVVVP
ncbi:MAG: hypothetical protein V4813_08740 [Gemmatimonadota bacterium]